MTQVTSASFPNRDTVLDPFAASPFTSIHSTTLGYSTTTVVRMQLLAEVTGDGGDDMLIMELWLR